MAAIDKMYLKDYYVFDEFRLWCLIYNPKLLKHFYHWNLTLQEWNNWKESVYNSHKEMNDLHILYASTSIEPMHDMFRIYNYEAEPCHSVEEVLQRCKENSVELTEEQLKELNNWFSKYPDTIITFG